MKKTETDVEAPEMEKEKKLADFERNLRWYYGIPPGSYDERVNEIQKSMPKKTWLKKIERYRNQAAIEFYNLDQSDDEGIREFGEKYVTGPIRFEPDTLERREMAELVIIGTALLIIQTEQQIYKTIVDKTIEGAEISEDELKHISHRFYGGGLLQVKSEKSGRWILHRPVYFGPWGILRAVYEWVYEVSRQKVQVGKCSLDGCNNIFIITPGGHPQRFCSNAHKMRQYRKRKKVMALP